MDSYPYELLGPIRFQGLSQALIVSAHPDARCMPLRGPDGGRDAYLNEPDERISQRFIVWQVKYREPNPLGTPTSAELFDWLTETIAGELPKIQRLVDRGITRYIVVTNISPSGHLDSGLADKVEGWLKLNVPLPAKVWWREDLDSRLADRFDLVFKYALFQGTEAIRAYFAQVAQPAKPSDQSLQTVIAALGKQYEDDRLLRFKQADLNEAEILDFFVDTPVRVKQVGASDRHSILRRFLHDRLYGLGPDAEPIGGVELLTQEELGGLARDFILEGAPGQGKSTLAQYLCQVHRLRILDDPVDTAKLDSSITERHVRFPFKIELRRYAAALARNKESSEDVLSIDAYICHTLSEASGGDEFSTRDLKALVTTTPSVFFLDALDEVPSSEQRDLVVQEIGKFAARLKSLKADYLLLVTTRPANFMAGSSAPRLDFETLELEDLTPNLVDKYVDSWIKQRKLRESEADDLLGVVKACLGRPHIADLSRNAMQLSILMYLIWTKGYSLPDKRTAMYEAYLSTFLDREAEKSPAVRDNRDLLLELHGLLGWKIHANAEVSPFDEGDISSEELIATARDYLEAEERDPALARQLFDGVQRFFVMVSRTQNRFEFEVQPLREFFAARYLYKTAPHIMDAGEGGTRPDRLEALIRNPYWLNVARFFAGWYDKGELADLSRRVVALCETPGYAHLTYPRRLIQNLLQDYVASASVADTRELAHAAVDDYGLRALAQEQLPTALTVGEINSNFQVLPKDSGAGQLRDRLVSLLSESLGDRMVYNLCGLLLDCSTINERVEWFARCEGRDSLGDFEWLRRGLLLGALQKIELKRLEALFTSAELDIHHYVRLVEADRSDFLNATPDRREGAIARLGDGIIPFSEVAGLRRACASMDPMYLRSPLHAWGHLSIEEEQSLVGWHRPVADFSAALQQAEPPRTRQAQFAALSDAAYSVYGSAWTSWRLALAAAAVSAAPGSRRTPAQSTPGLPAERAIEWQRSAASGGDLSDLESAMKSTTSYAEIAAAVVVTTLWAREAEIERLLPLAREGWATLPGHVWDNVLSLYHRFLLPPKVRKRPTPIGNLSSLVEASGSASLARMLWARSPLRGADFIAQCMTQPCTPDHWRVLCPEVLNSRMELMLRAPITEDSLAEASSLYLQGRQTDHMHIRFMSMWDFARQNRKMSAVGDFIRARPLAFPDELFLAADSLGMDALAPMVSLRQVSERERWFVRRSGRTPADGQRSQKVT